MVSGNNCILTLHPGTDNIFKAVCAGTPIGDVELYSNPFHGENQYLRLHLSRYEHTWAAPLFSRLQQMVRKPLQVMISSSNMEQADFLLAGGFVCKRKCYEAEVTTDDHPAPITEKPLAAAKRGQREYEICCRLLYSYYKQTHAAINPLTAGFPAFCQMLPTEALYEKMGADVRHFAFIQENEIAYIGSTDLHSMRPFAKAVAAWLFSRHKSICFEWDNCDPAAVTLKSLFRIEVPDSYDTYVLKL